MADFWSWQTKTLFNDGVTVFNPYKIQVAQSSNQFIFVDGRDGNPAKRIKISQEQKTISPTIAVYESDIGILGSTYFPSILSVKFNSTEDNQYTGIGMGSIFGYCYTQLNEYGEESMPSPLRIIDFLEWQKRGNVVDGGDYFYDAELRGSIQSISVRCRVTDVHTRGINLYRCSAYATESLRPMTTLKLVKNVEVNRAIAATANTEVVNVDIFDSYPETMVQLDYEHQIGSAGDDIALSGGTVFIANAVKQYNFPVEIATIHKITLPNPNDRNYTNQWIMLDLYDDDVCPSGESKLEGYSWTRFDIDRTVMLDTDFITPLNVWCLPINQVIKDSEGNTIKTRRLCKIQIPYIPANSSKDIYFVVGKSDLPDVGAGRFIEIINVNGTTVFNDNLNINPVRSENTLACYSSRTLTNPYSLRSDYKQVNKANEYAGGSPTVGTRNSVLYDEYAQQADEQATVILPNYTSDLEVTATNLFMPDKGYMAAFFTFTAIDVESYVKIMEVKEGAAGNPTINVYARSGINIVGVYSLLSLYAECVSDGNTDVTTEVITAKTSILSSPYYHQFYVIVSWQNNKKAVAAESTMKLCLGIMNTNGSILTGNVYETVIYENHEETVEGHYIDGNADMHIYYLTDTDPVLNFTMPLFEGDTYLDEATMLTSLKQLSRCFPYYPTGFIGIDYTTVSIVDDDYYHNANMSINQIYRVNDETPGIITWSAYGIMSALNSKNIQDEVIRIYPMRSFMPTIEHNTLLVWTRKTLGRVILSGETGDQCDYVIDFDNIGIDSADALVAISNGVAWHDGKEMYIYDDRGLHRKSLGRIAVNTGYVIKYDFKYECIWLIEDAYNAYVYDITNDNWFKYHYIGSRKVPDEFFLHKNLTTLEIDYCFLSREDYSFYTYSGANMTTKIKTKAYRIGRYSKIVRWMLKGLTYTSTTLFSYVCRLYGSLITNGNSTTTTYTGSYNKKTSVPHLRGENIQFEIDNADQVTGIEMEIE